jgi:hypothetical protein
VVIAVVGPLWGVVTEEESICSFLHTTQVSCMGCLLFASLVFAAIPFEEFTGDAEAAPHPAHFRLARGGGVVLIQGDD